uniref:Uncharacterized protein n=2 Tax=viral metagenome TaxID=1070528 RepID=A0A6H2A383_9ZZZZ
MQMSDPYETRRPWPNWAAIQKETLGNLGFTDQWEAKMTRKQELERIIFLNQQLIVMLEAEGKPADIARETIRQARREMWALESQSALKCVNW